MHNAQKSKLVEALSLLFSLSLSCGLALVKLLICPHRGLGAWVTLGAAFSGDLHPPPHTPTLSPRRGGAGWPEVEPPGEFEESGLASDGGRCTF